MDDDAPPGVPEWVVTYGDMMSLLLTFFIMLVSMSEVKADAKFRAVMESFAQYLGYPTAPASPAGNVFPLNSLVEKLDTLGSYLDEGDGSGGIKRKSLDGQNMRVLRNREGRPVPSGVVSFDPGSARLNEGAKEALQQIVDRLAGKPHKVDVTGYAPEPPVLPLAAVKDDAVPGTTHPRMLAYRRAKVVLEALERAGIKHERLRITANPHIGRPEVAEPAESPDRVEVFVLDQFAGELAGPRTE